MGILASHESWILSLGPAAMRNGQVAAMENTYWMALAWVLSNASRIGVLGWKGISFYGRSGQARLSCLLGVSFNFPFFAWNCGPSFFFLITPWMSDWAWRIHSSGRPALEMTSGYVLCSMLAQVPLIWSILPHLPDDIALPLWTSTILVKCKENTDLSISFLLGRKDFPPCLSQ